MSESSSKVIILDNIRSALNVGAIMRTCDGAGIDKLYLCGITPDGTHPKVKKTALGAENMISWETQPDTVETVKKLQSEGFEVLAVEQTEDSDIYFGHNYSDKVALVFGHEITGVSLPVLEVVDAKIELPMLGEKQSLNIATTVGIMAYHLLAIQQTKNPDSQPQSAE